MRIKLTEGARALWTGEGLGAGWMQALGLEKEGGQRPGALWRPDQGARDGSRSRSVEELTGGGAHVVGAVPFLLMIPASRMVAVGQVTTAIPTATSAGPAASWTQLCVLLPNKTPEGGGLDCCTATLHGRLPLPGELGPTKERHVTPVVMAVLYTHRVVDKAEHHLPGWGVPVGDQHGPEQEGSRVTWPTGCWVEWGYIPGRSVWQRGRARFL